MAHRSPSERLAHGGGPCTNVPRDARRSQLPRMPCPRGGCSQEPNMRIGEAASETGVTVKAIRHYEAVGLLGVLERDGSYRDFSADDLERLRLIAHCRD